VLSRCAWYDPHLLQQALHPILLPVIEDIVGGEVRLEEHQFLINYPENREDADRATDIKNLRWHRGMGPNFGSFQADGRYHCLFTKAFIYLTDNRPGEGTWVVPGSHRMDTPAKELKVFLDESLVSQIVSEAGDVLILSETLIHSAPELQGGAHPRYSLVYGYTAPFMQTWNRYDPPTDLLEKVSDRERCLLTGELRYGFRSELF
jgi:ectoine hydroxylase-related dioxygenase (phytanoyl-CoA dioxygenase family)